MILAAEKAEITDTDDELKQLIFNLTHLGLVSVVNNAIQNSLYKSLDILCNAGWSINSNHVEKSIQQLLQSGSTDEDSKQMKSFMLLIRSCNEYVVSNISSYIIKNIASNNRNDIYDKLIEYGLFKTDQKLITKVNHINENLRELINCRQNTMLARALKDLPKDSYKQTNVLTSAVMSGQKDLIRTVLEMLPNLSMTDIHVGIELASFCAPESLGLLFAKTTTESINESIQKRVIDNPFTVMFIKIKDEDHSVSIANELLKCGLKPPEQCYLHLPQHAIEFIESMNLSAKLDDLLANSPAEEIEEVEFNIQSDYQCSNSL